MMPKLRSLLILLTVLALSSCARGISVGSATPAETFSITVENLTGTTMIVSYDDGRGNATLGTVEAGSTERFIIAAPATQAVSVRGAAITGSRTSGPYTVTLVAGSTQQVRLR